MPTQEETIQAIIDAPNWDQRIAQIRLIPERHGTMDQPAIHAQVAKRLYVPNLAPDFAFIFEHETYSREFFEEVYQEAEVATDGFRLISEADLASVIERKPRTVLIFRTILGLNQKEFAHSTGLVAEDLGLQAVSSAKIISMENRGTRTTPEQALVAARTITAIMEGRLFGKAPEKMVLKQAKPDTEDGWQSVQQFAADRVPFSLFLHQRHYGGAFRQILDATSTHRGDIIEDAVQDLFKQHGVPFIRTGAHNQADIARRFQVTVTPAPDFVVFDQGDHLKALLECKGANDGGTARDKAARFRALRAEAMRLGGVPVIAVLGGIGWARVNDTLGPVVRDTDGRVFTLSNLPEMLTVSPFPSLTSLAVT